jgi:hypothetical protein
MFALGMIAESRARRAFAEAGAGQADRIMAAPVPVNPLRRQIVASFDDGAEYRFGDLRWTPAATFELQDFTLESGMASPLADRARASDRGAGFLQWARFPFVTLEGLSSDASVWIGDARYSVDARVSWAAVRIDLPADALPIRE